MEKKKTHHRSSKNSKNLFFRDFKSVLFKENLLTDEFWQFVEQEIWPMLNVLHRGYKIFDKKKMVAHLVHNLIETGLTNKVVADPRNSNLRQARKRISVWDSLVDNKLCRVCKGSEASKQITRYRATSRLLEMRELWELKMLENLELRKNTEESKPSAHALVVLYSGKTDWLTGKTLPDEEQKKPQSLLKHIEAVCERDKNDLRKPAPQAVRNGLEYFKDVESLLNDINLENLSHHWVAYAKNAETGNTIAFQPNVCLRQIHSGKFFRATRHFSDFTKKTVSRRDSLLQRNNN